MKFKLSIVVAVVAVLAAVSTLSFRQSNYKPRTSSKIEEVLSYQRPGGRTAAGMAEYMNGLRVNPATGTVSIEEYMNAIEASLRMQSKRVINSSWTELGPDNVGGRTRAFLQDKDTPSIMFVGSVSGGLFRSTTRGGSWTVVNDFQENLNVNCIAQSSDGSIVYGTGEGEFVSVTGTMFGSPGFEGGGIFRSTNRGRSFTRVNSTTGYGNINSMAADLSNSDNIVYAATAAGVRKSSDGGATWAVVRSGNCKEVKVASNGMVVAQSGNNIVKSTDKGGSWVVITPPAATINRASIAISPQDPNYIYIMASAGGKLDGVYRTTDGGANWTQIVDESTTYFDPLINPGVPQGNYNNVLTVNPLDKNHIIMGGVALAEWRDGTNAKYIASTNDFGGANPAYVHADKHVLTWDMSTNPPTLICGNDGGLFFSSDNLKTFTMKNKGFNATQFYAVAADYEGNVTGGSQDNGSQYINKKGNTKMAAVEIKSGDGFRSEISVKDNSIIFSSYTNGNITRSRDYGKTQSCMWDRRISRTFGPRLTDTAKYCDFSLDGTFAPFNTEYMLWEHPDYTNNESRLFLAAHGNIWMGMGITDFQKEPEWYLIATIGSQQVWDIDVTPDGNSVFVSNSTAIYRIDGLNSATYYKWSPYNQIPAGITITNLNFTAGSGRAISSVNLDPNNSNNALITLGNYGFSNYIYKGSNMLGSPTYTNITNNLPPMPVYDGLISVNNPNILFVGTDLGVYASDNGGTTWTAQNTKANNFPRVATFAVRQYIFPARSRGAIYAGTHGRGFYECLDYKTNINTLRSDLNGGTNLKLYPNPAAEQTNLTYENTSGIESATFTVFDLTGKVVMIKSSILVSGNNNILLETGHLKAGVYIVTGTTKTGNGIGTVKLVIRQ